ncbi:MAG: GIY-YIG nuclease family protein [Bauldia sp.]|nr:GIY-YIG nuclease family protein [Bauldia sp.]
MERVFWVYILASRKGGALYIGITNDLARRVLEHRSGHGGEHARRYLAWRLVHAESYPTAMDAIAREKHLKKWWRDWKIALFEKVNPDWEDNPLTS